MSTAPARLEDLFGGPLTGPCRDPHSVYRRLRREAPVLPIEMGPETGFFVSRYDEVKEVLRNDELFSNHSNAKGVSLVMGRTIIEMDGREHLKHRNLVTPVLAPRALRGDFPKRVREIADEVIGRFAERGSADLVAELTFNYPLRVFSEILGLPTQHLEQFHHWAIDLTHVADDPGRGLAAAAKLREFLMPLVEARRAKPTEDLISRLAHAQLGGERLTDEEVVSFLRLLVSGAAETTYHLMGTTLYALLTHREIFEGLVADRSRLRAVLDEALRWDSPVHVVTREAKADLTLVGVPIPCGAPIIVGIGSANRDERQFPDPDRFDPDRPDAEHIAFGFGKHYCAGSRFAYLEATVGLEALFDRLGTRMRLDPDPDCGIVGVAFRGPNRLPVRF
jgi:cytochrome P450